MLDFFRIATPDDMRQDGVPGGPYRWSSDGSWIEWIYSVDRDVAYDRHPTPSDDGITPYIQPEEYCGFQSWDQMVAWFGGFGSELHAKGYRVYHYKVPERRDGLRQSLAQIQGLMPMSVLPVLFK